jgi:hypothetical protein
MIWNFHAAVAYVIPNPIIKVASHPFVDSIGEAGYDDYIFINIVYTVLLLCVAILTHHFFTYIVALLSGNFIDVIDKWIFKPWLGKEIIHEWKFYPPVILQLTKLQTEMADLVSVIGVACLMIFIK